MLHRTTNIWRTVPALLFLGVAATVLWSFQDMIYTAHLRTPFFEGALFFDELMHEPFGLMRWLGCWFTQLAYYPLLATALYLLFWALGYWLIDRTLRLPLRWTGLQMFPFACMLLGLTSVGYWIYALRDWGFWFSQTLALTLMLVLLLGAQKLMKWKAAPTIIALLAILLYPILGWYMALMSLCLLALNIRKQGWAVLPLLLPLLSPGLWHSFYVNASNETMWLAGFPTFVDAQKFAIRPSAPFAVMGVALLLLAVLAGLVGEKKVEEGKKELRAFWIVAAIATALSAVGVNRLCFDDYNYQAEMRMSRLAMDDDWNGLISEAQKAKAPSHSMVVLKNIALMNTAQLGDRSFKLFNDGIEINNPDSIQLNSMQICSPVVYYNFGKLNFSIRWCMEFSVAYGFSPYYLMNTIRAAKGTGEERLVEKYMKLLRGHLFYKDWKPRELTPIAIALNRAYSDVLDTDSNDMESYLIKMFSRSFMAKSKGILELSLFNSMLYRNPECFWNAFVRYCAANKDKTMPLHYQEAYLAFMNVWPTEIPFEVKVNQMVQQSFNNFLRQYDSHKKTGLDNKAIGEEMKPAWHGTYFWFMVFGLSPK